MNPHASMPVDTAVAFTDPEGLPKPACQREMEKRLALVAPIVARVLEPGETVKFVAPAISPFGLMEWLMTGWLITSVKRCWVVVTDRRLLQVPSRANGMPRGSIAEVRYGDAAGIEVSSFFGRKVTIRYRDGGKEELRLLQGRAASKLAALLPSQAGQGSGTPERRRRWLCPRCGQGLPPRVDSCPACRLALRTRAKAITRSWLYPGGGYFYTGHPVLGVLDAMAETFLMLMALVGLAMMADGADAGFTSVAMLALLAVEKLVTVYHATHYIEERLPERPDEVTQGGRNAA